MLNHTPNPVFGLVHQTPQLPDKLPAESCWADALGRGSKYSITYLAEDQDKALTQPFLAKINNVNHLTTCPVKTFINMEGIPVP